MALGILFIMFVIISILSLVSIALLFLVKDPKVNSIVFYFTVILGIVIGYINVTALPSNEAALRIIVGVIGALALIAVIYKIMNKNFIAKMLAAVSVVVGALLLFW